MSSQQFEIFSNVNGHVYDVCYGRDNAILRAKGLAQKLCITIGIAQGEGPAEYFSPVVAKAWTKSVTRVRNWEMEGWSDEDYDEMTRQASALMKFVSETLDDRCNGGAFTPEMLRGVAGFVKSKSERLEEIAQVYQ